MKYYFIAGEASGDLYGSKLIKEILKLDTKANIRGWGGDLMESAGANIVKHYRNHNYMGFLEVLRNLKTIINNLKFCKSDIKKFKPVEEKRGNEINDDEDLVKAGSDYTQTRFHPVGTCKMGQDDMAVVDEKLRVKGIKNLRVVDASIMPNITSGNTNAPTIMIAEKGADMILKN